MTHKNLSFKTKLITVAEVLIIATNATLGYAVWKGTDEKVRETTRQKLMAIASSAAAVMDASSYENIKTASDEESEDYEKNHAILHKLILANPGVDDIYTMRKTDRENIWSFVVSGYDTFDKNGDGTIEPEEERVGVGEEYDVTPFPEMKKAFSETAADYDVNCDSWGCFLSGYAPVADKNGKTDIIVGVDISAGDLIAYEKKSKELFLAVVSLLLIAFPVIMYFFLKFISDPVKKIAEGIENFTEDLSYRMKIKTGDEFELIGNAFNMMAGKIEDLYSGLEKRVKEKTKELEKSLRIIEEDKAKDEAVLAGIGEGLVATDRDRKIILLNNQAELMLGISKENVIGKYCEEVFKIVDEKGNLVPEEKRPVTVCIKNEKRTIFTNYSYVRKDGLHVPLFISASPVIYGKEIVGAVAIFSDITKEKQIDRAKSEFVSLASHQLLTPLSNIKWFSEMLLDKNEKKTKKKEEKYMSIIKNSTERMVDLVKTLLNVSRIEMGTFMINPKPLDIYKVIDEVLEEFKLEMDKKKIQVEKKFDTPLGLISADEILLRIVFQNIVSNAIKYSQKEKKIAIEVSISKKDEKNGAEKWAVVSFSDQGIGIPENQQEKIFTKLFRADNISETDAQGTGLGLYITKSIADASGCEIRFSSEENKGSVFSVSIPLSGMKGKKGTKTLNEIKTQQV